MEGPLERTFGDAEGKKSALAVPQHNSKPETAEKCAALRQQQKAANGTSYGALMAHGELGVGLIDFKDHIKGVLGHGHFESIVKDELGIESTWRTSLMFLGRNLTHVEAAIAWGKATDRFTGTEYSVRVVNSLLKAWLERDKLGSGGKTASSPEQTEMRWSDVLHMIDWAKTRVKDSNHGVDQVVGLLREWEAGDEKTESSAESAKRRSTYGKEEVIKALVLTSSIANSLFSINQQQKEHIAVLKSELEWERAMRAPTTPEPRVQEAILASETTPEGLITDDGESALPC